MTAETGKIASLASYFIVPLYGKAQLNETYISYS